MKKLILATGLFLILIGYIAEPASAAPNVVSSSAQIRTRASNGVDFRVLALKSYLEAKDSPLAEYTETLINTADEYSLDWRLIPAITGVESSFGKRIPTNSYNAYGWANGAYSFESWEESINIVSKTLREKYYDRGARNINQIAKRYAPPSTTWAGKVKSLMKKIDGLPVSFTLEV